MHGTMVGLPYYNTKQLSGFRRDSSQTIKKKLAIPIHVNGPRCAAAAELWTLAFGGDSWPSIETNVLEFKRKSVDAARGRSDPVGELTWFDDPAHQGFHKAMIVVRRQPVAGLFFPRCRRKNLPVGTDVVTSEVTNFAVEARVRKFHAKRDS